jgi:hypothetical protein
MCSLYLVWNILPVCPMYFSRKSKRFIFRWQFYYVCPFVGVVSPNFVFCSVFEGYFYLRVFKQSCYFPCSFSTVCESDPFLFPVLWVDVCILPLWGWMLLNLNVENIIMRGCRWMSPWH